MSTTIRTRRSTDWAVVLDQSATNARLRVGMLIVFALLISLRMPDVLFRGRLWAEEGIFFGNAWSMPPWRALFVSYGGYLNLVANAAAVLARWTVPLEGAPFVMSGVALLFQLCPAILIAGNREGWLRSHLAAAAALLALALVPMVEEVWLQTLHSQYQLVLCACLILSMPAEASAQWLWFRRGLLLLAPLTGLLPVALIPLFILRAIVERSRQRSVVERSLQAALLLAGSAIQLGFFYSTADAAALGRSAHVWLPGLAYTFLVRHVVLLTTGLPGAVATMHLLSNQLRSGVVLWPLIVDGAVIAAILALCLRSRRSTALWLFGAATLLALVSYSAAIKGDEIPISVVFGQRYTYVPQVLLLWTLIAVAAEKSWVALLVAWCLMVSAAGFTRPSDWFAHGPSWREAVAEWRAEPGRPIQLWPQTWSMPLNADHSPAPQAGCGAGC